MARQRQLQAEDRQHRMDEVRCALRVAAALQSPEVALGGIAALKTPCVSSPTPAVSNAAAPLYVRLRRKEESRSLGGRLGFDCRSL